MNQQFVPQYPAEEQELVLSYLGLRKAVGTIGFALPGVLALGTILLGLDGPGLQPL